MSHRARAHHPAAAAATGGVERVSLAIETRLLREFDQLLVRQHLGNRSEAVRGLVRRRLIEDRASRGSGTAVGTLTLIYDHEKPELADRLVEAGHAHHADVLATLHVHLDARLCLEVMALRGRAAALRAFADHLIGLKGVIHGELVVSSTALWKNASAATAAPARDHRQHGHRHTHNSPPPRARPPRRG